MTQKTVVTSLGDVLAYYGEHSVIGRKARLWAVVMHEAFEGHVAEKMIRQPRNDCLEHIATMFGADVSQARDAPLIQQKPLLAFMARYDVKAYEALKSEAVEAGYLDAKELASC